MRRLGFTAFAACLLIALVGAVPAYANHNQVGAQLVYIKDGTDRTTAASTVVNCSLATCEFTLPVHNREFGRVVRWTGGFNTFTYFFSPFGSFHATDIEGSSRLDLRLEVRLLNNGVQVPHGSNAEVTVTIVNG